MFFMWTTTDDSGLSYNNYIFRGPFDACVNYVFLFLLYNIFCNYDSRWVCVAPCLCWTPLPSTELQNAHLNISAVMQCQTIKMIHPGSVWSIYFNLICIWSQQMAMDLLPSRSKFLTNLFGSIQLTSCPILKFTFPLLGTKIMLLHWWFFFQVLNSLLSVFSCHLISRL